MMINLRRMMPVLLVLALIGLGGAGCTKEARKNRYLARGNRDFAAQQYAKAEIEYQKALQVAPLNPVAVRQLGFIYHEQGRIARAYAWLHRAAELEPDNAEVQLKLGMTDLGLRQYKEAGEEARKVLAKQPGQEEALSLLADSVVTTNALQQAGQYLDQLPQQEKNKAGYHVALGTLDFKQLDLAKAESEFNQAAALEPKSASVQSALGSLYWARNELPQAGQAFKTAAELSPLRSPRRLRYADFEFKTGAVEEAKKLLTELTQKVPDYLPAWNYLAQIAFGDKKFDDCAALIQKVLAQDPADFEALLLSGSLKMAKGNGPAAVAEFEHMKSLYGGVPQVHYQLALAYLLNGDANKAAGSLNKAISLDPNFAEAILMLAGLNLRQGDPAAAIVSLSQLVQQQPQIAQAHLLLAAAYLTQGNLDGALAVYQQMARLFPKNAQVPYLTGIVLARQGKPDEARKAFTQSLELLPDYLLAVEQLVNLDIADKQYATALDRVKQQMDKHPKAGQPWLLQAEIHTAQKDWDTAQTDLLKAIELDPGLGNAYVMLAQVYVAANKPQQAVAELTSYVSKTNDVSALMRLGIIQQGLTNYAAAREAYEKILTVNSNSSSALNNLAYLYSEHLGQIDQADQLAERARQLAPNDPYTADTLGWILFKQGNYPRALTLLQESADKLPAEPEAQFHLGMAQYMVGDEGPARLTLQRAVEAGKDFPEKDEARQRLALLAIDVKTANAATVATLEQRLEKEPNDLVVLTRLAAIYQRDGAVDKAAQTYEAALKRSPQNAQLMIKLAQLYSSRADGQSKALALAKAAHSAAPDDPNISRTLSRLVYQTGDYQWALSLIQEAARKLPGQPDLSYDLAWSYYSVGQVGDAEAAMQSALQAGGPFDHADDAKRFLAMVAACQDPAQGQNAAAEAEQILKTNANYIPGLMVSATMRNRQGSYDEAKQLYEKVLAGDPFFTPAARDLAILYVEHLGDDPKAYDLATKARGAFPEDAELAKALGILVYRRGDDYARAAQLLKESVQKRRDDAELLYYLGMTQYRLKQTAESKQTLQQALALNMPAKLADEARRVLAEMK